VAVFSKIIQQKRALDAGQLFPFSHAWNDRPSFRRKMLYGQRSFSSTNLDFWSFIFSKNEIKEEHSKRNKVDNLNLHQKRLFIDQYM